MNKLVKIGFVSLAVIFLVASCSETTAQSADTTQESVKNSSMAMSIEGMTCATGCARAIETELNNVDGVSSAVVDFKSATASIEFNPGIVTESGLLAFVNEYKDGSYKAITMVDQKINKSKASCCASKSKSCSSDKKASANNDRKSCSESESAQ